MLFIPRALVILASLWIFFGWLLLFGPHPPVQPQVASYGPPIQMLMMMIGVGIGIGWPLLRLTGQPSAMPAAQAALDGLSIFVLLQVVVWPLRLVTSWTLARAISLDAAIAASITLTAALLALTQGCRSAKARTLAMVVFVALSVAPGVGAAFAGDPLARPGDDGPVRRLLVAGSSPALLVRCSEPITLDPSQSDREVLFRAFALASAGWLGAISAIALGHWLDRSK